MVHHNNANLITLKQHNTYNHIVQPNNIIVLKLMEVSTAMTIAITEMSLILDVPESWGSWFWKKMTDWWNGNAGE